jgi:hypothetical protein
MFIIHSLALDDVVLHNPKELKSKTLRKQKSKIDTLVSLPPPVNLLFILIPDATTLNPGTNVI